MPSNNSPATAENTHYSTFFDNPEITEKRELKTTGHSVAGNGRDICVGAMI